jgi:hypothetical protein
MNELWFGLQVSDIGLGIYWGLVAGIPFGILVAVVLLALVGR